jgi:hypothetical protein
MLLIRVTFVAVFSTTKPASEFPTEVFPVTIRLLAAMAVSSPRTWIPKPFG